MKKKDLDNALLKGSPFASILLAANPFLLLGAAFIFGLVYEASDDE